MLFNAKRFTSGSKVACSTGAGSKAAGSRPAADSRGVGNKEAYRPVGGSNHGHHNRIRHHGQMQSK
jgi:hypothetical protein